jgi:hypothetical protein
MLKPTPFVPIPANVSAALTHFKECSSATLKECASILEIESNLNFGLREREEEYKSVLDIDPLRLYSMEEWSEYGLHSDEENRGTFMPPGSVNMFSMRRAFVSSLSFSVPSREAVETILAFADGQPIHEHLAGTAYWSYFFKEYGAKTCAFDLCQDEHSHGGLYKRPFHDLYQADIHDVSPPPDTTFFISWIPYESGCAELFLRRMHSGQKVVIAGEFGGCCARDETFDLLDEQFDQKGHAVNPSFSFVHDRIVLYVKK